MLGKRSASIVLLVGLFFLAFGFLVSGSEWLTVPLTPAFPLPVGNLAAATVYIAIAAVTVIASRTGTPLRWASYLLLAAAILWLPLSMLLSGNLNFNFNTAPWRWAVWSFYTYKALPGGVVLLLLWRLVGVVVSSVRRHRSGRQSRMSAATDFRHRN